MSNLYGFLAFYLFVMISVSVSAHSATDGTIENLFKSWEQSSKQREEQKKKHLQKHKLISINERKTDLSLIRNLKSDSRVNIMENAQLPFQYASEQLYKKFNLSRDEINNDLPRMKLVGKTASRISEECRKMTEITQCDFSSKYRRIDGQCNNRQNPRWGSAEACQPRLLPANYEGVNGFRLSRDGQPLPRPRQLSLNIHYNSNRPTNYVTHMYMFFGQFLDHDITFTPPTTIDNQSINCCPEDDDNHPQCAPILISEDDPFYSEFNITCMNFVRSASCLTCTLGPRQLMNQVTSTIDASVIYGNSEERIRPLRGNRGRLRTQRSAVGELMPLSSNPENDQCSFPETNDICFESGDSRANQHTVLTSLHTMLVREHNRIATRFSQMNPQWSDEKIFQEARRLVGAQMQAIAYNEYLPITLGYDRMSLLGLWPGRWTEYNPNVDPTTSLEFTTAAFRFGHTLINSVVAYRPLNATNQLRYLRDEFFQPFPLYTEPIGPLMAGASRSPAQLFDRHLVPDVTNYLYRVRGNATGLDLVAININRGRDHGIPTYVDAVSYCSKNQVKIRNFQDLVRYSLMQQEQADVLQRNYRYVEDIDMYSGILSEIYMPGAVVGPTAACFIGLQFQKLKYGDRFYFEHINQAGSFTYRQLEELRRATLSQIICLNTVARRMPRNAMLFASGNNPYIDCRSVRGIDLSYWKE